MMAAMFLELALAPPDVDAEAFGHAFQRLAGERAVAQAVARAVQADHEAIADQLVGPDALDGGDILDPGLGVGGGRARQRGQSDQDRSEEGGKTFRHRRQS
jgi:hypothetical protein